MALTDIYKISLCYLILIVKEYTFNSAIPDKEQRKIQKSVVSNLDKFVLSVISAFFSSSSRSRSSFKITNSSAETESKFSVCFYWCSAICHTYSCQTGVSIGTQRTVCVWTCVACMLSFTSTFPILHRWVTDYEPLSTQTGLNQPSILTQQSQLIVTVPHSTAPDISDAHHSPMIKHKGDLVLSIRNCLDDCSWSLL